MQLSSGTRLGPYEILGPLGAGGMGEVYRAKDTKLDREVAVKVMPAGMAGDRERLARFEREGKVLASLNHPNIAQIYGLEENALVMELVLGQTLTAPLPLNTALRYARQIAEALEAAHEKGITHRDLKPANVMITPEGTVKVLDFGLASVPTREGGGDASNSPTLTLASTQAGMIMGTAAYMSPEQAAGKVVDKRSDIWSFGVVLYEMLAGKKLFGGETISHILAHVLTEPIDLKQLPATTPRPIVGLLKRCLERDLKSRLRDIGEARIAIEDYLANPKAEVVVASPARRPWLWMVATGVALVATTVGFGLWMRTPQSVAPAVRVGLGVDGVAQISPDGRWLLASSESGLRVRPLQGGAWKPIPGTEGASANLFWSEDSSNIGFVSGGRLRIAALEGTGSKDLAAAPDYRGGTWRGGASDGTIVYASDGRLNAIDVKTLKVRALAIEFPKKSKPAFPAFLPEGDGFVFVTNFELMRSTLAAAKPAKIINALTSAKFGRHPRTGQWHLFFVAGGDEERAARKLMTAPIDPRTGALLGEPALLLQGQSLNGEIGARFSVGKNGLLAWRYAFESLPIWRLTWFDHAGKVLGRIGDKFPTVSLALSPDESKVAVAAGSPDVHIWIYDAQTGAGKRISNLPGSEAQPSWAPDGKSIFFKLSPSISAPGRLIRQSLDSASRREELAESISSFAISSDGKFAIVGKDDGIYRLDLQQQPPPPMEKLVAVSEVLQSLILSPDNRSMVYAAQNGVYYSALAPGGMPPQKIAELRELYKPFFSQDGKTLYGLNERRLFSYPVLGNQRVGERTFLFQLVHNTRIGARVALAAKDGKRILAITTDDTDELDFQLTTDWTTLLGGERK